MATNWNVLRAERGKTLPATEQRGELVVYRLVLDGAGEVEKLQKPSSPPPKPGDVIYGMVEEKTVETQDGPKVFKKFRAAQRSSYTGSYGKRDPAESKRIERMACHKTAAHLLSIASDRGLLESLSTSEDLLKAHSWLADRLQADVEPKGEQ